MFVGLRELPGNVAIRGIIHPISVTQKGTAMKQMTTYSVPCLKDFQAGNHFPPSPLPCAGANRPGDPECPSDTFSYSVKVPGSKSITNRALLLATLAEGTSVLEGVLFSDDSRHFLKCIQELGFEISVSEETQTVSVTGLGGAVPKKEASLYVGSAGTAARFITAYLGLSNGTYCMDSSEQMRRRPMSPLLNGLTDLGCEISCKEEDGHFPFVLHSHGFRKYDTTVNIDHSSQFLSALMISSCLSPQDFLIRVEGSHGMSYIEMTCRMMEQFGVHPEHLIREKDGAQLHSFVTAAGQHYRSLRYRIEPDASAAGYFYAMCPLLNLPIRVEHIHSDSLQGDVEFLHILERLGCRLSDQPEGILLLPPEEGHFPGITVDMGSCSDQAITMAAIAPFADSPTTITGIGHIRYQECDRLSAIVTELSKMGIRCEADETSVTIHPGTPKPALVETYDDHRMAMGFSLIGLRCPGIVIDNPMCCRKTFENYFDTLDELIGRIQSQLVP